MFARTVRPLFAVLALSACHSAPATGPRGLRFDGVYRAHRGTDSRYDLQFFDDGTARGVPPNVVDAKWLPHGTWRVDGDRLTLWLDEPGEYEDTGAIFDFAGPIAPPALTLELDEIIHVHDDEHAEASARGRRVHTRYDFVANAT